jgi:hypothetical protein
MLVFKHPYAVHEVTGVQGVGEKLWHTMFSKKQLILTGMFG